ncbi:serine hydrolase domain-containing protein [Actinopolymorpha cephalotaxi]|uniref:CubicO group peptidase (Beta-lactamase class C family) n=2 Tax=Actinopolymorpha cephalotaxi TaxID=504797 RepID=A0ABX2SDH6_9ACTN|nr:serine hydrolase domain-containing protein [Actinopolymorpha cephalotaxi]NYH86221.1 CubicO group peptidase (beta-lactamase class C family) [Actinopolymorpha cephalotaxi]
MMADLDDFNRDSSGESGDFLPSAVEDHLRARMKQHHIPALGLAVVRGGRPLARAYGTANLEWDAPATTGTAFQLASVTKLLTATLLMLVVEDGTLRLDAPVGEYLPDAPPSWDQVTVRRLTSHTSGLSDDVGSPASVEEAARAAFERPLEYEPGTQVRYGLSDYVVLAYLLQSVTGRAFPDLLRERLTDPLGMTSTRFDHAADDGTARVSDVLPRRATIYDVRDDRRQVYAFLFPAWTYAAGGLYSSAADLATWAAALRGGDLLSPASVREMWTPERLRDGSAGPFGVGWIVDQRHGSPAVGHSGGPALADVMHLVDDDLTVAVLTNQQNLRPYLAGEVADLLRTAG